MTMEQATMQEHIKTFKKRLRGMGFQKKSDRVFWYDNNGLFYVVSFKMAGKVTAKIGFEVSHAGLFDDGTPKPRHCPVGGWLGPWGLCDGFSVHGEKEGTLQWLESVLDADFLEHVACDFFSYFKRAADWQIASKKMAKRRRLVDGRLASGHRRGTFFGQTHPGQCGRTGG